MATVALVSFKQARLYRVVNERLVRDSVQINNASLILSPTSPAEVFAARLGRQSERGLDAARRGRELLASRRLMLVTAVCCANRLHLFTLGALKQKHFSFLFLKTAVPTLLLQPL